MQYAIIGIVVGIVILGIIIGALIKSNRDRYAPRRYRDRTRYEPGDKGDAGESVVAEILGDTIEGKQYVINDLLFCIEPGKSCQIDHIYINKSGIWVIETKNYAGTIYGEEKQREWTQVLGFGDETNKLYNPIKQNSTHIYHLSKYLKVRNIFQNVVVFLSNADISNVTSDNVYSEYKLHSIKTQKTNISLSVREMEEYYYKLLELKLNKTITLSEHIDNIHRKQELLQQGICPRCGGKLVLRQGRYNQFYGCSNYPKCKFTKNVEKEVV